MSHPGARAARILAALAAGGPAGGWPQALVESCRERTAVSGVGLALMSPDGVGGVVAATDGVAQRMEDLQFSLGEGPCHEAARTGSPVLVPDVRAAASRRWPAFGAAAIDGGVEAVFTFPLRVGMTALGVLDLYRGSRGVLTAEQELCASSYADAATAVLLHLQDTGGTTPPGGRNEVAGDVDRSRPALADVVDRRAVVLQAAGMISVQLGTSPEVALVRLRAHAFGAERSILDVAADVVARRLRFDHSDAGTSTTPWSPPGDRDAPEDLAPHD